VAGCTGSPSSETPTRNRETSASPPTDDRPSPVVVEGEDYDETNFRHVNHAPPVLEDAAASGGRYLKLATPEDPPTEGYTATYEIVAPSPGYYAIEILGAPFWEDWISTFEYRIGDESFRQPERIDATERYEGGFSYRIGTVELEEGANTFTVRVTDRRRINERDRYVMVLDRIRFQPAPLSVQAITGEAPMNVFTADETVRLTAECNHPTATARTVAYEVSDYDGETVTTDTVALDAGSTAATIDLGSLSKGHYTVRATVERADAGSKTGFVGVVTPVQSRETWDHPFASMSGASRHVPAERLDEYASVLRRGGLSTVREVSVRWSDRTGVNPSPGTFDWSFFDRWLEPIGEQNALLYQNATTPSWARSADSARAKPEDLRHAYQFAHRAVRRYGDLFEAWEIDNEPELHGIRPHRLGAYAKASAIAVTDADADIPVVVPGWSSNSLMPGANEIVVTTLENDLAPYVDVYNHHNYQLHEASLEVHPTEQPAIQYHQALRETYGLDDLPFWVTEAGIRIRTEGGVPMSADDRRDQARFVVTSAITSIALGVDRYFWFVYHPFPGQTKYGTFAENWTPRPSLVAYAVLSDVVADGTYLGQAHTLPEPVVGHVFGRASGGEVLVLWSSQMTTVDLSTRGVLPDDASVRTIGPMGETTDRSSDDPLTLEVGPDPIYVETEQSFGLETRQLATADRERALGTGAGLDVASRPAGRSRPDGEPAGADGSL
jgi:hypothetical protein